MRHNPRQLTGDGAIDIFHDAKIGGEKNVKVALLYLQASVMSDVEYSQVMGFGDLPVVCSRAPFSAGTSFERRAR